MPHIPDLVRLTRLDTQFSPRDSRTRYTQHKCTGSKAGRRNTEEVERWQRTKALGRGSYGAVYLEKCIHGEKAGRVRAVKKIRKPFDTNYYRELEALAFFSYPKYEHYFVKSLGWYEDRSNIFISMEYIEHGDLQQYIDAPLPQEEAKHITYQILEGLDFMHENGFAHRDLKPANIMVVSTGPEWWIKIADFGLTKRALEDFTQLRTVAGTPAFAAPEVLGYGPVTDASDTSYTTAVDLWSTGVIAFLIVTGDIPFRDQRQLGQYAQGLGAAPFDALTAANVDEHGCELIRTLMAPDPKVRPGTRSCLRDLWFASVTGNTVHTMQSLGSEAAPASLASGFENGHTKGSSVTNETYADWPHSQEPSARWTTGEENTSMASAWSVNTTDKKDSVLSDVVDLSLAPTTSSTSPRNPFESGVDRTGDLAGRLQSEEEQSMSSEESYDDSPHIVEALPPSDFVDPAEKTPPELPRLSELQTDNISHGLTVAPSVTTNDQSSEARDDHPQTLEVQSSPVKDIAAGQAYYERNFASINRGKDRMSVANSATRKSYHRDSHSPAITPLAHETDLRDSRGTLSEKQNPRTGSTKYSFLPTTSTPAHAHESRLGPSSPRAWGKDLLVNQNCHVWSMTFSPHGRHLVLPISNWYEGGSAFGGEVQLWDTASGILTQSLRCDSLPTAVAFSPDGQILASATSRELLLWDSTSGARAIRIPFDENHLRCHCVAFSADGNFVAVTAFRYLSDDLQAPPESFVGVWSVGSGGLVRRRYSSADAKVFTVAALPNGSLIAASWAQGRRFGENSHSLRLWNVITGVEVQTMNAAERPGYVTISSDGRLIATSAYGESTITVWYVGSGTLLSTWRVPSPRERWFPIAFSSDGTLLASGASTVVAVWDVSTGRQVHRLENNTDWIRCLAFSPDGAFVSSASADGTIRLWDLQSTAPADHSLDDGAISAVATRGNMLPNVRISTPKPGKGKLWTKLLGRSERPRRISQQLF
ncbi:hypothetical protein M409DRAFT_26448 [Zasmidium cellare ATCC 36951]|uniref:non-specific serine/threonine protein kinase n=1 Tax=Zasmidium cellare ATCC 36951 TaxID=1080233 RepID=A0A6A6C9T7_ZASCE|nr:uncharacterized protein M409DRAFT_26448 [Zasmidium cellare ATCC 36951]KAF2163000.1 hypothetical protein M409DRAFT_26448 [Zasmidium cellare ATCC 36951]